LREKREGSDVSSSQVAPVAHVLLVSLTIHERRFTQLNAALVRSMPLMPVSARPTPLKSASESTETHYG
jgi:hypothetical protein